MKKKIFMFFSMIFTLTMIIVLGSPYLGEESLIAYENEGTEEIAPQYEKDYLIAKKRRKRRRRKKRRRRPQVVTTTTTTVVTTAAEPTRKPKAVVFNFANKTKKDRKMDYAPILADILNQYVLEAEAFKIINRDVTIRLMDKEKIINFDLQYPDIVAALGILIDADIVYMGTYEFTKNDKGKEVIKLQIKAIDTKTNKLDTTPEMAFKKSDEFFPLFNRLSYSFVQKTKESFPPIPLEGKELENWEKEQAEKAKLAASGGKKQPTTTATTGLMASQLQKTTTADPFAMKGFGIMKLEDPEKIELKRVTRQKLSKKLEISREKLEETRKSPVGFTIEYGMGFNYLSDSVTTLNNDVSVKEADYTTRLAGSENGMFSQNFMLQVFLRRFTLEANYRWYRHDMVNQNWTRDSGEIKYYKGAFNSFLDLKIGIRPPSFKYDFGYSYYYATFRIAKFQRAAEEEMTSTGFGLGYRSFTVYNILKDWFDFEHVKLAVNLDYMLGLLPFHSWTKGGEDVTLTNNHNSMLGYMGYIKYGAGPLFPDAGMFILFSAYLDFNYVDIGRKANVIPRDDDGNPEDVFIEGAVSDPFGNINMGLEIKWGFIFDSTSLFD